MQASILDCFVDLISIKNTCDDVTPTSGVYLDEIGLPISSIDEFVTGGQESSYALFTAKKEFALKLISNQIHNYLSARYLEHTLLEGQRLGQPQENLQLKAGVLNILKGINVEFYNYDSYVDLYVSELSLQLNFTGTATVKVYDLLTNTLLDSIPVSAIAGQVISVYPAKTYKSKRKKLNIIFVVEAPNPVDNYLTQLSGAGNCSSCGNDTHKNSYLYARAITIDKNVPKIKQNLSYQSDTGGLSVVYSLVCNHQDWLCTIAQRLAIPLAYKTAAELMHYCEDVSTSERINTYVFANGDKIKERIDKYERKFALAMDDALQSIKLPSDTKCFVCNNTTSNRIVLP